MKLFSIMLLSVFYFSKACGQNAVDTADAKKTIVTITQEPAFPGGPVAFLKYIQKNLTYPEVAQLIGVNGTVNVSFTVGKTGRLINISATDTIGAGCEEEAVRVISMSPIWTPAIQNNIPVAVNFSIPIRFSVPKESISFKELKKSNYIFIFDIKGTIYTEDNAEAILGKTFPSENVLIALPYSDKQKYPLSGKAGIYLIKIKS